MNFTITPAASKFIRLMIRADGDASSGFRLAVSPGGCSGLAADISVRREPAPGEAVVERDGVKLFLPAESRILLDGVLRFPALLLLAFVSRCFRWGTAFSSGKRNS